MNLISLRKIYTFVFWLTLPFILLRFLLRSRKISAYRQRLKERLGIFALPSKSKGLWVHAVSLGEVIAAIPLIQAFLNHYPNEAVMVTTTTPTGSEKIQKAFGEKIFHVYLPLDLPFFLNRFIKRLAPRLLVIMETELWPNLLYCCHRNKIPILLANARLSAKSAKNYAYIRSLMQAMLKQITYVAAQAKADQMRYIELGMSPERISVTGSLKFDIKIPNDLEDRAEALRRKLGTNRLIWIAASTHAGEEEVILAAFAKIKMKIPRSLLILVPRHPERFALVSELCKRQGYTISLRSKGESCTEDTDIFIGDTIGELLLFYASSDVAFVGGSMIAKGGHNSLEPAALGKPIVLGPSYYNFAAITEMLQQENAAVIVQDLEQLATQVIEFLQSAEKRVSFGERAKNVVIKNRGALVKQMEILLKLYA